MTKFWEENIAAWAQKKLPAPADVTFKKIGGWDAVAYQIPQSSGSNSHIRAEWLAAGTWIDLHMSIASDSPSPEGTRQLESLLSQIRVTEKAATSAAASSSEAVKYIEEGSRSYVKHDYPGAIGPYAKALELDKKQSTLDKTLWRVLIDNLGMAYGITGDLKRAKETFDYGLSKDKTYPMFYYNLACTYTEMNDVEGSIANLRLAFRYKDNVITGEQVPDPRQDDSFQRFAESERFNNALREMGVGK
jgi:tetratricopeptide (TPR) repeat protein